MTDPVFLVLVDSPSQRGKEGRVGGGNFSMTWGGHGWEGLGSAWPASTVLPACLSSLGTSPEALKQP